MDNTHLGGERGGEAAVASAAKSGMAVRRSSWGMGSVWSMSSVVAAYLRYSLRFSLQYICVCYRMIH